MHAMLPNAKGFLITLVIILLMLAKPISAQEFTVNLKDTDIQEFIEFVADVTGTTIVIDPSVKGKVKVVSSKPVSRAELYDLFLSILDVHGYTAVRSGEVVRVIPNKNARSAPVDVISGTSVINDEYVTQVIRLDNVSAAKLIPVLRPWYRSRLTWPRMRPVMPSLFLISVPTSVASPRLLIEWIERQ
jgi:general secretion pathway protein D